MASAMSATSSPLRVEKPTKSDPDFVTVVSVGNQPAAVENFVTVLSIGSEGSNDCEIASGRQGIASPPDGHPVEQVEVFRLPGEPLGFGLKFEGGAKNAEKIKRLFVQSCAEQSPASRVKCSWGSIGEGDEVLSIDEVPVIHMSRHDCVRRLKESQLVIKLLVRCRGSLRPEVVSAERKSSLDVSSKSEKIPPELPSVPPPVPPRKLRQTRGSADGEANPAATKKMNGSPKSNSSGSSSQAMSPQSQSPSHGATTWSKYIPQEPSITVDSNSHLSDRSSKEQEPPEPMVYLDARSQDDSSTHGSTSDETGSSMSTVVDRLSTSDRVSVVSTLSTTTTGASDLNGAFDDNSDDDLYDKMRRPPIEQLERDFFLNSSDYLLKRLANSEAVTHVESRGEAGGVVERITAVVAPNTILIEETLTLQPPLSFQDAPLSYGDETRPDLTYIADLAGDSTTHFRPIRDEAAVVASVNSENLRTTVPALPARNHVNKIPIKQQSLPDTQSTGPTSSSRVTPNPRESLNETLALGAPPKPMPRKEVKSRRKRPPPPPPPPRRDPPPPASVSTQSGPGVDTVDTSKTEVSVDETNKSSPDSKDDSANVEKIQSDSNSSTDCEQTNEETREEILNREDCHREISIESSAPGVQECSRGDTNKVLEIIEMKKVKELSRCASTRSPTPTSQEAKETDYSSGIVNCPRKNTVAVVPAVREKKKLPEVRRSSTVSVEMEDSESSTSSVSDNWQDAKERLENSDASSIGRNSLPANGVSPTIKHPDEDSSSGKPSDRTKSNTDNEDDDDETYRSLDEIKEDSKGGKRNGALSSSDEDEDDAARDANRGDSESASDDSGDNGEDDYFWQSDLATIGEEEEASSLEYTAVNKDTSSSGSKFSSKDETKDWRRPEEHEVKNNGTQVNADRMDNCGGDQRLPPDGDEFPAAYQEFSGCASEQYQYVATLTKSAQRAEVGASSDDRSRKEAEDALSSSSGSSSGSSSSLEARNEPLKSVRRDSVAVRNSMNGGSTMSLRDKSESQPVGNQISSQYIAIIKREALSAADVTPRDVDCVDSSTEKRANDSYFENSSRSPSNQVEALGTRDKSFEIPGYYPKARKTSSEIIVPKYTESMPPPLPLTRPPKLESPAPPFGKDVLKITEPSPQRKFSVSSEQWCQDDKSEKSVRDKIAMFSSQNSSSSPLLPNQTSPGVAAGRRLFKYKSTENMLSDEGSQGSKEQRYVDAERRRGSVELINSRKNSAQSNESSVILRGRYEVQGAPSLPKTQPPEEPAAVQAGFSPKTLKAPLVAERKTGNLVADKFSPVKLNNSLPRTSPKPVLPTAANNGSLGIVGPRNNGEKERQSSSQSVLSSLARSPSLASENSYSRTISRSNTATSGAIEPLTRANSLASSLQRSSEDIRRQSLNQLIEQRRKGISKLRGLVIPEKNGVSVDKPIIDLPEIKSRDSILLHQVPKATIHDKWGSQSSIASTTSSVSSSFKPTTSFKMPAPQIMSKYSPAFKRKSLEVYSHFGSESSTTSSSPVSRRVKPSNNNSDMAPEPKSFESVCSPTRSDSSLEFVSSTNVSLNSGIRKASRPAHQKIQGDYDDSDNDSAVSSSQSSVSRGFSPPTSPAPSERSSMSSERSYRSSLIMEMPSRTYQDRKENANWSTEDSQYLVNSSLYRDNNKAYSSCDMSSSASSNSSSLNPRSASSESSNRSQIPQRQVPNALKRSSSTETNCSTSSSSLTLTSGSQVSTTESLSRRVLKPQSVEAINRKNILASAKCRSGRDLSGSPQIQRKFSDAEEQRKAESSMETGKCVSRTCSTNGNSFSKSQDVKVAYNIEVTGGSGQDSQSGVQSLVEDTKKTTSNVISTGESTSYGLLETSNDLKMWVQSEAKALMAESPRKRMTEPLKMAAVKTTPEPKRVASYYSSSSEVALTKRNAPEISSQTSEKTSSSSRSASESSVNNNSEASLTGDLVGEDLLTTLTTKSRSRAPINLEDRSFSRSLRQMSLEDILVGKPEPKLFRTQSVSVDRGIDKSKLLHYSSLPRKEPPVSSSPRSSVGRPELKHSWSEDRSSISKVPIYEGSVRRSTANLDESGKLADRFTKTMSKTPTHKLLDRRSASITDIKIIEKTDVGLSFNSKHPDGNHSPMAGAIHHRFSSLDSSVEERTRRGNHEPETERFNGEQFGSISSLASSTSLISQQELAQLVEEASRLEDPKGAHDVVVVLLHKENPHGNVGITLAGGVDCEAKEITVHRVLAHSVADKDGRVQRGDRILSINGRSTRGLNHRESLAVLKQPRSEVVLVVSRSRVEEGSRLRSRTDSVETIVEGLEACSTFDDTAWGPAMRVAIFKDGAGLGFSLAGGRDSPLGDRPLVIKKIFTGGAAEKTAALTAGDQLLEVNGIDVTQMSRIEAWSLMKKLSNGEANLLVRHPAIKSS